MTILAFYLATVAIAAALIGWAEAVAPADFRSEQDRTIALLLCCIVSPLGIIAGAHHLAWYYGLLFDEEDRG